MRTGVLGHKQSSDKSRTRCSGTGIPENRPCFRHLTVRYHHSKCCCLPCLAVSRPLFASPGPRCSICPCIIPPWCVFACAPRRRQQPPGPHDKTVLQRQGAEQPSTPRALPQVRCKERNTGPLTVRYAVMASYNTYCTIGGSAEP